MNTNVMLIAIYTTLLAILAPVWIATVSLTILGLLIAIGSIYYPE